MYWHLSIHKLQKLEMLFIHFAGLIPFEAILCTKQQQKISTIQDHLLRSSPGLQIKERLLSREFISLARFKRII